VKTTHSGTSKRVFRAAIQSVLFSVFIANIGIEAEDRPPTGRFKIAVYNYSAASPTTLARAEREASRILSKAGFEADWVECRVPLTAGTEQTCAADSMWDIHVRILDHPRRNTFGDGVFGFAVAPMRASVYYDSALHVAKTDVADYEMPLILGSTIAHEIGHLLLGPIAHSASGIMQAEWKRNQLDQIMKQQLAFTPEQASIIRSEFAIRLRLQPTSTAMGSASN
jgi:hypothetical protein